MGHSDLRTNLFKYKKQDPPPQWNKRMNHWRGENLIVATVGAKPAEM